MSEERTAPGPGSVAWRDLTVDDAAAVRDFYAEVVGWSASEVDMGGYTDYELRTPAGDIAAGICHARADNAELPPVWLIYVIVEDLDASLSAVRAGGGEVEGPVRGGEGEDRWAVIRHPAGAALALYEPARPAP